MHLQKDRLTSSSQCLLRIPHQTAHLLLLGILGSLIATPKTCVALPDDRKQIMQIRADSADLNHQKHRGIYLGHVEIDQGSTHIRAHKAVTVGNQKNQLIRAHIEGNLTTPAHYSTLTEINKPELHAWADKIYYLPEQHLIKLIGHARIQQGKNHFSAPSIDYHIKQQHVVTQHHKSKERTVIVIHPENHTEQAT